nr:PREDICTED: uncharacterized protein LOC103280544 [Anolis carolinensis]XP_008118149.1 PREDICTED: uncharacterized protein LOC103280544 [Anolis carolinensis]|eukprot:XP_008118148.1 PREDICTED: uncharacterized protein LOC103280544 [Anolis carolinensis]
MWINDTHQGFKGIVPKSLLGKVQAAFSDLDGKRQPSSESEGQKESEGEVRRRRRRHSVSNFVTETLSKFKTSRSLYAAPCQEIKTGSSTDSTLRMSFNSKRKASEDVAWAAELSVKKRRSGLDSLSFDTFVDDAGDPCIQPMYWGSVQGKEALSPPSSTVQIQRKRSGSKKKHTQRKHPVQTSPSSSPTSFERKDTGRKSLRIFSRQSKDLAGEPSSWLLVKKMVPETIESPTSQEKWAQLQSYRLRESATGFPRQLAKGSNCPAISIKPETPPVAVKCKNCKVPSPGVDYVMSGCQEMGLDDGFEKRGVLDKAGYLVRKTQPLAPPAKQDKPIRRSISWSEGLSMNIPTEETDFSPDEIPLKPGQHEAFPFDLPDAAQLDMEVLVAGVRQLGISAVCVTPVESCDPGCPENGPRDPLTSTPNLCDSRIPLAEGLCQIKEVPKSRLKCLTLNFQASETSKVPKRKGGRRFGRSISHESGLPLQAEQEAPTGQSGHAKKGASVQSPRSPLQSFKAYGRQIFISRKHIMMSFAGLRGKKEAPCPRGTEGPTVATPEL